MVKVNVLDMIETLRGQCRNVSRHINVVEEFVAEREAMASIYTNGECGRRCLLVGAGNIKICKGYWSSARAQYLEDSDLVVVYYGFSQTLGALADCSGNRHKDDYRRLCYAADLEPDGPGAAVFREVVTRFTEDNLRRAINGLSLV